MRLGDRNSPLFGSSPSSAPPKSQRLFNILNQAFVNSFVSGFVFGLI